MSVASLMNFFSKYTKQKFDLFEKHAVIIIALLLTLFSCFIYLQVKDHEFIDMDDRGFVIENQYVLSGLTLDNLKWAFSLSNKNKNYWCPLTWISYMLDVQLWGIDAGRHHLSNLFLHIINTLLLFLVLNKMTGALWKSAFVAALFAFHPINVDSVAWIAERKNLLSTSFWFIAMLAYFYYTKSPSPIRYMLVAISYIMGLLAKPMLVTFPFVLLLLDYWPLGRITLHSEVTARSWKYFMHELIKIMKSRVILEKIPLILIAVISIYMSVLSLKVAGNIISTNQIPLDLRISNALVSYIVYLWKFVWPYNLGIYYPFPLSIPFWQSAGAFLLIVFISVAVVRYHKTQPYLAVGWFWFIGTLIPVSGIYQAGFWPAMADRWAYVPFIGVFIMVAWGIPGLWKNWRYKKYVLFILAGTSLSILLISTWIQAAYWKNSETIFKHTIKVTQNNEMVHLILTKTLIAQGDYEGALNHCDETLKINPNNASAYNIIGKIYRVKGEMLKSIFYSSKAIQMDPGFADSYNTLGVTFMHQDKLSDAIRMFSKVLEIEPENDSAYINIGTCLKKQNKVDEAIRYFNKALKIKPDSVIARSFLGETLLLQGKIDESIEQYKAILKLNPSNIGVQQIICNILEKKDKIEKAAAEPK